MSNWFSIRRYVTLQILRAGAFVLLGVHYHRHISSIFGVPALLVTIAVAMIGGLALARARLRRSVAPLVLFAAPWLLRLLVDGVLSALALVAGGVAERLPLLFETLFWPALPLLYLVPIFTWLVERNEPVVVWEVAARAVLLFVLFWNQDDYGLTLYPHPAWAALAVAATALVEAAILVVYTRRRMRVSTNVAVSAGRQPALSRLVRESAAAVPMILLALLLFGAFWQHYREQATRAGGGLIRPAMFSFEFAELLELESSIRMSDELVLLFRREGRARRQLLRTAVLDGYSESDGFHRDHSAPDGALTEGDAARTVGDSRRELTTGDYFARERVRQELYLVNFNPDALFALPEPVRIIPYRTWDDSSFSRVYEVESEISTAFPPQLRRMGGPDPEALPEEVYEHYTDYGDDRRIAELAREVAGGEESAYEAAQAIEEWFHDEFFYSLSPGVAPGGDQLHHFLFDVRRGYCTYFAYGMALMARSLGVPARVAVGFIVDPAHEVLNFYTVRADTAHAWVEVYIPDYGWIEFDPTSTTLHPDEEFERAPPPDREEVAGLLEEILEHRDYLEEMDGDERRADGTADDGLRGTLARAVGYARRVAALWYTILPALYLLLMAGIRVGPLLTFGIASDPRTRMAALYRHALVGCAAFGLTRARGESRMDFARTCAARGLEVETVSGQYLRSVFAPRYDEAALRDGVEAWREFRASLPARLNTRRRLLAALDPRAFNVRI